MLTRVPFEFPFSSFMSLILNENFCFDFLFNKLNLSSVMVVAREVCLDPISFFSFFEASMPIPLSSTINSDHFFFLNESNCYISLSLCFIHYSMFNCILNEWLGKHGWNGDRFNINFRVYL